MGVDFMAVAEATGITGETGVDLSFLDAVPFHEAWSIYSVVMRNSGLVLVINWKELAF